MRDLHNILGVFLCCVPWLRRVSRRFRLRTFSRFRVVVTTDSEIHPSVPPELFVFGILRNSTRKQLDLLVFCATAFNCTRLGARCYLALARHPSCAHLADDGPVVGKIRCVLIGRYRYNEPPCLRLRMPLLRLTLPGNERRCATYVTAVHCVDRSAHVR